MSIKAISRIPKDWGSVLSYDCAATKYGKRPLSLSSLFRDNGESSADESGNGGKEK